MTSLKSVLKVENLSKSFSGLAAVSQINFDVNRLKAGLYRHPWDDIVYMVEKA